MAVVGDNEPEGREPDETNTNNDGGSGDGVGMAAGKMSRKEKRKLLKKMKRKQLRREMAIKERENEEAMLNDPEVQMRLLRLEQEEAERMERDRREFEERERQFRDLLEVKRRQEEEEEERRNRLENDPVNNCEEQEMSEGDDWEYVEEGPAEIIWKGNEIVVKKKKVKVLKKVPDPLKQKQESERPISNPLAPQSVAFEESKSAQEVLESVAQEVPNFGTEQDKAHCPFHLKTGVCRFGARCSRVHFYPDKSCTLLIKNMYSGPGLAWEQDEGLEYTDEEVDRSFEEFYEDVHTEFLKFGEIVNFKVCKNASSHLRGNVYVQYNLLQSAVLAFQSINGRYFAGKQLSCEYVNVTRWKVAICGEYMKSRLLTCSRGSVCNFIHCFRNPGGDYEWADWDKPAPRYWLKKMAALFGHSDDRFADEVNLRYCSRRSRSKEAGISHRKSHSDEDDDYRSSHHNWHRGDCRSEDQKFFSHRNKDSRNWDSDQRVTRQDSLSRESCRRGKGDGSLEHKRRGSSSRKRDSESIYENHHSSEMLNKFDGRNTPHADSVDNKYHRFVGKDSSHKKNYVNFSDVDFTEDSLDRDEGRHHKRRKNSLQTKDEFKLSDTSSNESRLGGAEVRSHKNIRNIQETESRRESLGREDNCLSHGDRKMSISESASDEARIERGSKRPRKIRSRRESQSDSTDNEGTEGLQDGVKGRDCRSKKRSRQMKYEAESSDATCNRNLQDRVKGRHRRSKKRRRQMKYEEESSDATSDGGRLQKHEKLPQKNGQRINRVKHESEIIDKESHKGRQDKDEARPCSSKKHDRQSKQAAELSDDASDGSRGQEFQRRPSKQRKMKSRLKDESNISDANRPEDKEETVGSTYGEADTELEQAYRLAALKKLEEMRRCKDTLPAQGRELDKCKGIHSHENKVVEDAEGSKSPGSGQVKTRAVSFSRRRI